MLGLQCDDRALLVREGISLALRLHMFETNGDKQVFAMLLKNLHL